MGDRVLRKKVMHYFKNRGIKKFICFTSILLYKQGKNTTIPVTEEQEIAPYVNEYIFSNYYYYSVPLALIVALIFLSFFALTFGNESKVRKDALDKIQEVISKENEIMNLHSIAIFRMK